MWQRSKEKDIDQGMNKDLTQGKPAKVLWLFCLPILISAIFQQFYNMADSIIAGKVLGEDALAAVGASYPITMIFTAVAFGFNLGCSAVTSKFFGEKNYRDLKSGVSTVMIASVVLGAMLTAVGVGAGRALMQLLDTPADIMDDAMSYLYIYTGGFLFVLVYNVCTGVYSALGDSRTPLVFLVASSVANVGMDLLFTMVIPMGVAGLAWATFICQGAAGVICMITMFRRVRRLPGENKVPVFSWRLLGQMFYVAVPSVVQQSVVSVGNLLIQYLVNGYGASVVAGYSAAIKLNTFIVTSLSTVAGGLTNFTAQNLGAGELGRAKRGTLAGLAMAAVMVLPFSLSYALAPETMLSLFLEDGSSAALSTGVSFLTIVAPFYITVGSKVMFDSVLRGAQSMTSFMFATLTDLVIRVALCFALDPVLGIEGIWWSWPIGWGVSTAVSAGIYLAGRWYKSARAKAKFAALAAGARENGAEEREGLAPAAEQNVPAVACVATEQNVPAVALAAAEQNPAPAFAVCGAEQPASSSAQSAPAFDPSSRPPRTPSRRGGGSHGGHGFRHAN